MPCQRSAVTALLVGWLSGFNPSSALAAAAPIEPMTVLPAPFTAQTVLPPQHDAKTALAHRIFQHLLRAGDRNRRVQPQLFIVGNRFQPWAVALPGGQIVLSRRALEIALTAPTPPEAEARLAFVLGHELAHLLKNDYWHQEVYQMLAGMPDAQDLRRLLVQTSEVGQSDNTQGQAAVRAKEAQADDLGFLAVAVAGFAVHTLLADASRDRPDFFADWMRQTQTKLDPLHPAPEQRAQLLRARLLELHDQVGLFHAAVQAAHFGRYAWAEPLLRAFARVFPSREVANNLGYVLLQQARGAMPPAVAYEYCLPTLLDHYTRALMFTVRDPDAARLTLEVRTRLEEADTWFEQAATADPDYLPARLNAAITHYYQGHLLRSRLWLDEAGRIAPDDVQVRLLSELLLYLELKQNPLLNLELAPTQILRQSPASSACGRFNLARALQTSGQAAEALAQWEQLVPLRDQLAPVYRAAVCEEAHTVRCPPPPTTTAPPAPWPPPVLLGLDVRSGADSPLRDWRSLPVPADQGLALTVYRHPEGHQALAVDHRIELASLSLADPVPAADFRARQGEPVWVQPGANGEVWAYGGDWTVVVRDNAIREIWYARLPAGAEGL